MNNLPKEVNDQIMLFSSHSVDDLLKPHITATKCYQALRFNGKIRCRGNCEETVQS